MIARVSQLLTGLIMYGVGCAVMIAADIGLDPWNVFAQGLSALTGVGIGWITNIVGFAVLLLWLPLRQKPGLGTVLNILIVGTAIQLTLPHLSTPPTFILGCVMFVGGVVLVGLASGLYLSTRFGAGPRDGLMTGISARFGWPIWVARTAVEVSVLLIGWLLGGMIGLGTVLFALMIGPLCHAALRLFERTGTASARAAHAAAEASVIATAA